MNTAMRWLVLFALPVLALTGRARAGDFFFDSPPSSRATIFQNFRPEDVVAADFDGDGHLDLALLSRQNAETFDSSLTIAHGVGNGQFRPGAGVFLSGERKYELVSADFNEDGRPDLAVLEIPLASTEAKILVVLNTVDGMGSLVEIEPSQLVSRIVIADVNEDGHADMVTYNRHSGGAVILLGNGDATFEERHDPTFPVSGRIVVGEYTGDEHVDIVVSNGAGVSILPGDGTGNFGPPSGALNTFFFTMTGGDFNGDGIADLARLSEFPALVEISFGDGGGGFLTQTPFPVQGNGSYERILGSDLNLDGISDLIVFDPQLHFEVFLSDPNGVLQPTPLVATSGVSPGLTTGDFDGDGDVDIVTSLLNENRVLFHAAEPGGYDRIPVLVPPHSNNSTPLSPVDLDLDGHLDLMTHDSRVLAYLGSGTGEFEAPRAIPLVEGTRDVRAMMTGEFNGDGRLDLAYLETDYNTPTRHVRTLLGGKTDLLVPGPDTVVNGVDLNFVGEESAIAGDLDGDGIDDLVLALTGDDGVRVLLGSSTGEFTALSVLPLPFAPTRVMTGDWNDDGHLDVAVSRISGSVPDNGRLTVFLGDGTGSLQIVQHLLLPAGSRRLLAADLDADGHQDILSVSRPEFTVFLGLGSGQFAPGLSVPIPDSSGAFPSARFGFFDDDEYPDLISAGYLYSGPLNLAPPPTLPDGLLIVGRVAVGDFDEDGADDATFTSFDSTRLYPNRTRFHRSLQGNVNATVSREDVLFANGLSGFGRGRGLVLDTEESLEVRVEAPSSSGGQPAPFAMYAWRRTPSNATTTPLLFGLGDAALPMPMNQPVGNLAPIVLWNNIVGFDGILGTADRSSSPAPGRLFRLARIGIPGEFTLQGLIRDSNSSQGQAAVTNALVLEVR